MYTPNVAKQTLLAIDAALEKDQGALFRKYLRETMPKAEDAFREDNGNGLRTHLGASAIGRECDRELWYGFRWALVRKHEGKLLRLFNRGHLEEPRFIALLLMIGCEVWTHDGLGRQFRFMAHGGHFAGSTDGVVRGIPERPNEAGLLEFKTHSDKSFSRVTEQGVRSAKFEHFVQMQMYMGALSLPWALYMAVNKNDDDLYGELVDFDQEMYERNLKRAGNVVFSGMAPPKISLSPGWFACKWCDYHAVCHLKKPIMRSCRTCVAAVPQANGTWRCERFGRTLSKEDQIKACDEYLTMPL